MGSWPYTQTTAKLRILLGKLPNVGVPEAVDKTWLASVGFGTKNEASMIPVLKAIGFVDPGGRPTGRWKEYRNSGRSQKVLAEGVHEAFEDLFAVYPDADRRSDEELKAFFQPHGKQGLETVLKICSTFKTLCGLADFTKLPLTTPMSPPVPDGYEDSATLKAPRVGAGGGVTVNVNIQLVLPDNEAAWDKLFECLKKHLLSG